MTQFKIQNRNRAFIFPGSRNHITGLNFIADIFFQRRIIAVDRKVAGAVIQNNQVSVASQVICKNHLAVPAGGDRVALGVDGRAVDDRLQISEPLLAYMRHQEQAEIVAQRFLQ